MNLSIGKLAKSAGVGVETVRYYQRRGLLRVPEQNRADPWSASMRRYDEDDLRRLKFIRAAQAAGFTLAEIAELLRLDMSDDRARVRALARARIDALDAKIAEMEAARSALVRLADQCASSARGPCPILQSFEPQ